MELLICITLLFGIFVSSMRIESYMMHLLMKISGSRWLAMRLFCLFFLPGTILHEFCHLAMAQILGVRTGMIELMPRIEGEKVVMGEVRVQNVDLFRRVLIGAAPFLIGFPLTLGLIYVATQQAMSWWQGTIFLYAVFQAANASFASEKDMEGVVFVLCLVGGVMFLGYHLGLPIWMTLARVVEEVGGSERLASINRLLLIPLIINMTIWLVGRSLLGR